MTQKIAGSGLTHAHLVCVYQRSADEGIVTLLSAKTDNKERVTARKDILTKICEYLAKVAT